VDYLQQRMGEGVYNARKLFMEIQAQGYLGGETQVRDYVHHHRPPRRQQQATIRFETEPGQQAQVDWGSFGYVELAGRRQ
jgi:transposase